MARSLGGQSGQDHGQRQQHPGLSKGEQDFSGCQLVIPIRIVGMNFSARKSARKEDSP